MKDEVREVLIKIVNDYGTEVCEDPRRCRALLSDLSQESKKEINVLINALESKIHIDLLNEDEEGHLKLLKIRLAKRVQENYAIMEEAAVWAVDSWAIALNKNDRKPVLNAPNKIGNVEEIYQPPLFQPTIPEEKEEILQVISGVGDNLMKIDRLDPGLHVFELEHDGSDIFYVELQTPRGEFVDMIANEIGNVKSSKAIGSKVPGEHFLKVQGDGKWNINIKKPSVTNIPNQKILKGIGQQATPFVLLHDGSKLNLNHTGKNNFIVTLLDENGAYVDLIANTLGSCNLRNKLNLKSKGSYIFDVLADGKWSIKIS